MITYSVHEPPWSSDTLIERADRIVFVKEGIAWWAFVVPVLWLIYQNMWLVLLGFLAVTMVVSLSVELLGLGETAAGFVLLGLQYLLALEANDLRRWTLRRRGFEEVGLVTGKRRDDCEFRFFSTWLAERQAGDAGGPVRPAVPPASSGFGRGGAGDDVVGVFPGAGG
ncbi:MAG: DUF2628 domain-containing protein [Hyphomicrobiales bacterium]|nr:DUF2628 domain-containing protein [Hyphomicrobiales bacterium]